eukprot:SAG25_NODE_5867_length_611_cov_1.689453_1_plen_89_part_00
MLLDLNKLACILTLQSTPTAVYRRIHREVPAALLSLLLPPVASAEGEFMSGVRLGEWCGRGVHGEYRDARELNGPSQHGFSTPRSVIK